MSESAESVFAWSVQKLKQLNFDGDADALAAYVDALIENNRESEGGDKALLRSRTYKELEEFLGQHEVSSFVKALMAHLSCIEGAAPAATVSASEGMPALNTTSPVAPTHAPHFGKGREPPPQMGQRGSDRASRVPTGQQGRGNGSARTEDARRESLRSGDDNRPRLDQNADMRNHPAQGDRDTRPNSRNTGGRNLESASQSTPSADLRHQLSRSRANPPQNLPSKRVRDFDDREGSRNVDRGDRESGGRPRDRNLLRGEDRAPSARDDLEPPSKNPRQHVGPGPGRPSGTIGPGMMPMHPSLPTGRAQRFPGFQGPPPPVGPMPPGGLPPGMPPPPEFLQQMQRIMAGGNPGFSPHPGLFQPPGMMGQPARPPFPGRGREIGAGNGRMRGRDTGGDMRNGNAPMTGMGTGSMSRQRQQLTGHARGRSLNSVLVLRSVPEDKLSVGVINDFFKTFGSINNIMLRPTQKPDHAYIEFSSRSEAQAAHDSVEAVMGNRHVRLYWAREHDFELDGIPLNGMELAPAGGSRRAAQPQVPPAKSGAHSDEARGALSVGSTVEDQEALLQKKRKEIAAAREEQLKTKAQRQSELNKLFEEQKSLLKRVEEDTCSKDEKKRIAKQLKSLSKQADTIRTLMKPKEAAVKSVSAQPTLPPVQIRPRAAMSADFRPKIARVAGATQDGLTSEIVQKVFRDTVSVSKEDDNWVIDFASRRAAESATKAIGVLKKSFGPSATITLSDSRSKEEVKSDNHQSSQASKGEGSSDVSGSGPEASATSQQPSDSREPQGQIAVASAVGTSPQ